MGSWPRAECTKSLLCRTLYKHQVFQTEKIGIDICKEELYIVASPDDFMSCTCHRQFTIEIKCLFNFRDKKITDGLKKCKFLTKFSVNISINKGQILYTNIITNGQNKNTSSSFYNMDKIVSQMDISKIHQAVFIVFVEYILFDKDQWENVKRNLNFSRHMFVESSWKKDLSHTVQNVKKFYWKKENTQYETKMNLRLERSVFVKTFEKNIYIYLMFLFLLKRPLLGIFSCFEILFGCA